MSDEVNETKLLRVEGTDPRGERIAGQLATLVGPGPAAFYRSALRVIEDADRHPAARHLVGHCMREIESAVRDVLRQIVDVEKVRSKSDSHSQEIDLVLKALAVPSTALGAEAWAKVPGTLHASAHRRDLRRPQTLDAQFMERWIHFNEFLQFALATIGDRFAVFLDDIDRIVGLGPGSKQVSEFLNTVPHTSALWTRFFEKIDATWLEMFRESGLFAEPPPEGPWVPLDYLARVAGEAPAQARAIVSTVPENGNLWVREQVLSVVLALPLDEASATEADIPRWLCGRAFYRLPDLTIELISKLVAAGHLDRAFVLATAVVEVKRGEDVGSDDEAEPPHVVGHLEEWKFEQALGELAAVLGSAAAGRFLELLVSTLTKAIELQVSPSRPLSAVDRRTQISRPEIELSERPAMSGVVDILLDVLCRSATDAPLDDVGRRALLRRLLGSASSTVRRVGVHLLTKWVAVLADEARVLVLDRAAFDSKSIWREYSLLLRAVVPGLSESEQTTLLEWIKEGPPASPDDVDHPLRAEHWRLHQLTRLGDRMPAAWGEFCDRTRERLGFDVDDPVYPSPKIKVWIGPASPVDLEDLEKLNAREVVDLLKTWEPKESSEFEAPSKEGLAHQLGARIQKDIEAFNTVVQEAKTLAAIYLGHMLIPFWTAAQNGSVLQWPPLLDLLISVVELPRGVPDRDFALQQAATLLEKGLGRSDPKFPAELRPTAFALLCRLAAEDDPAAGDSGAAETGGMTASINSVCGTAVHGLIAYGLSIAREAQARGDKLSFDLCPELRVALECSLADPSPAVRGAFGFHLQELWSLDRAWTEANLRAILSDDDAGRAAWDAHLFPQLIVPALGNALKDRYLRDVVETKDVDSRHIPAELRRAVENLMVLHLSGLDELGTGGAVDRFFLEASPALRGHAMTFLGRAASVYVGEVEVVARLQAMWNGRRRAAEDGNALTNIEEMSQIGWWVSSRAFEPAWVLQQLADLLEGGVQVVDEMLWAEVLDEYAEEHAAIVMRCVAALIERPRTNWSLYAIRKSLLALLPKLRACGDTAVSRSAIASANRLVSLGMDEFRACAQALTDESGSASTP